jgi:hypothetical protein
MLSDGQTPKKTRRHQECLSFYQREGLGIVQSQSSVDGFESIRASITDRSGQDSFGTTPNRNSTSGKILERLELIEVEYLSYVHGHQERLETRLEESKIRELNFKLLVKELKQEIYNLTSQNQGSEEQQE